MRSDGTAIAIRAFAIYRCLAPSLDCVPQGLTIGFICPPKIHLCAAFQSGAQSQIGLNPWRRRRRNDKTGIARLQLLADPRHLGHIGRIGQLVVVPVDTVDTPQLSIDAGHAVDESLRPRAVIERHVLLCAPDAQDDLATLRAHALDVTHEIGCGSRKPAQSIPPRPLCVAAPPDWRGGKQIDQVVIAIDVRNADLRVGPIDPTGADDMGVGGSKRSRKSNFMSISEGKPPQWRTRSSGRYRARPRL
ncbi:hypothetical protein BCh11DRAFT_03636 [Burkholderia sp. Ch1-1]|nr:hypothetical protein BCh11DRAFT_03636 [Burkholderia sp. Ch1-1]